MESPRQKPQLAQRWLMLALLCSGLLGSYYCYDNPSATQVAMQQFFAGGGGNATSTDDDESCGSGGGSSTFTENFNNLYSVYSWPNVVLPFFGGYLSDRLGTRLMLLVFLLFITLGQAIFALGSSLPGMAAWYVMWAGRTVFGFGGESLSVAQSALIASWFSGKELAFALGLNLSLARMGSVINDKASDYISFAYSVPSAFWVGFGVCLLSLLAGIFTFVLDERSEDILRGNAGKRPLQRTPILQLVLCLPLWRRCCCRSLQRDEEGLGLLVDNSLQEDRLLAGRGEGKETGGAAQEFEPEEPTEVIELSAATQFPLSFWLLCVPCVCTYACVLCFNNVAGGFFAQKWLSQDASGQWVPVHALTPEKLKSVSDQATTLLTITYLVAAFLAPLFGGVIDYIGYRAVLTAVSSGLITVRWLAAGTRARQCKAWAAYFSPPSQMLPTLPHSPSFPPLPGCARDAGLLPAGCGAPRGPPGSPWPVLQHLRQRPVALRGAGDGEAAPWHGLRHCHCRAESGPGSHTPGRGQAAARRVLPHVRCVRGGVGAGGAAASVLWGAGLPGQPGPQHCGLQAAHSGAQLEQRAHRGRAQGRQGGAGSGGSLLELFFYLQIGSSRSGGGVPPEGRAYSLCSRSESRIKDSTPRQLDVRAM